MLSLLQYFSEYIYSVADNKLIFRYIMQLDNKYFLYIFKHIRSKFREHFSVYYIL